MSILTRIFGYSNAILVIIPEIGFLPMKKTGKVLTQKTQKLRKTLIFFKSWEGQNDSSIPEVFFRTKRQ